MKKFGIVLAVCLAVGVLAPTGCNTLRDALDGGHTATAYIAVTPPRPHPFGPSHNIAADLKVLKDSYVKFATKEAVLLRAVNDDIDEDGNKLNRIRKTAWFTGDANETVKQLQSELSAVSVKDTNLIRLSLRGPDLQQAVHAVNAVADAMVHATGDMAKQQRTAQMKTLIARLDEIDSRIASKQKEIEQIRGRQEPRLIVENRNLMQKILKSLTSELAQLRLLKTQAEKTLSALKEQAASGELAESLEIKQKLEADPTYRSLLINLKNLKTELNSLKRLGPSHRRVKSTQARIELVEQTIAEMKKELTEKFIKEMMLKQESQVAAISERLLVVGNQYNELLQKSKTFDADVAKISKLENEIEQLQERAKQVEAALLEFRIALPDLPLRVRAPAEVPAKR